MLARTVGLPNAVLFDPIGTADPAPRRVVITGVADRPTDAGRLQAGLGRHDRLDQLVAQQRGVLRLGVGPQTPGGGRCAVRVGRGDQHPIGPDACPLGGQLLRLVDQLARHGAVVGHHDGDPLAAVVQDHRPGRGA